MATIPQQYRNFQTESTNESANRSPLQLALIYYMGEGQEVPFFINHDWLRALTTFATSGVVNPNTVGGFGPIVVDDSAEPPAIYTIEPKPDCGPDDTDRYERVYRGSTAQLGCWTCSIDQEIRGGSAADGVGGPWGTGGLTGPDTSPGNGENLPPPIVSNAVTTYGASAANQNSVNAITLNSQASIAINGRIETNGQPAATEQQIVEQMFPNKLPTYLQGIA